MVSIAWFSQNPATLGQVQMLEGMFKYDVTIVQITEKNVTKMLLIAEAYDDWIVQAPKSVLIELISKKSDNPKQPLWAEVVPVDNENASIQLPNGRKFEAVGFRRILNMKLEYFDEIKTSQIPLNGTGGPIFISEHEPTQKVYNLFTQLYPHKPQLQWINPQFGNKPGDGFQWIQRTVLKKYKPCDLAIVAPIRIIDELCQKGLNPVHVQIRHGNTILRRAKSLVEEFGHLEGLEFLFPKDKIWGNKEKRCELTLFKPHWYSKVDPNVDEEQTSNFPEMSLLFVFSKPRPIEEATFLFQRIVEVFEHFGWKNNNGDILGADAHFNCQNGQLLSASSITVRFSADIQNGIWYPEERLGKLVNPIDDLQGLVFGSPLPDFRLGQVKNSS
jgi:hypothetical protein